MPVSLKVRAMSRWQPPHRAESTYCEALTPIVSRQVTKNIEVPPHPSVPEFQRHLHESRLVELRRSHAKCGVRRGGINQVRLAKLHPVKKIESFRAKFDVEALGDCRSFEHGEIKVRDSRTSQNGIRPALVAK